MKFAKQLFFFGSVFFISAFFNLIPVSALSLPGVDTSDLQLYQNLTAEQKASLFESLTQNQSPTTTDEEVDETPYSTEDSTYNAGQPFQTKQKNFQLPSQKLTLSRIEKMFLKRSKTQTQKKDLLAFTKKQKEPKTKAQDQASISKQSELSFLNKDKNTAEEKAKNDQAKTLTPEEETYLNDLFLANQASKNASGKYVEIDQQKFFEKDVIWQYGYDIFKKPWRQSKTDSFVYTDIPVGADYLLGPGDTIIVNIWGKVEEKLELTLDREGKVFLPQIGYIYLADQSFGDVQKILKGEFSKYYVNFKINVSMGKLKTIKIFVLGEAKTPGAYNLLSLSTIFQALYIAGGPTKMGSLRNIKLIRNNKIMAKLDLYQYLLYGTHNTIYKLQANDTIFIPPIGKVVQIDGMVKRPAIYEIKKDDKVAGLIRMAGGVTYETFYKRIQIDRIDQGKNRLIEDLNFKNVQDMQRKTRHISIKDGDIVHILAISPEIKNYITVIGNVHKPGDYEYRPSLKLKDLIKNTEGFKKDSYLKRIEIYRYVNEDERKILVVNYHNAKDQSFVLQDRDLIKIYSASEIEGEKFVKLSGAIKEEGQYKLLEGMRVLDLVHFGKLEPFAILNNAELFRQDNDQKKIITLNLTAIMDNPASTANILLQAEDQLFIRTKTDVAQQKTVRLSGQIVYPGEYAIRDGEKLSSIIKRAGGYTEKSFLKGAIFTRKSIRQTEQDGQIKVLQGEYKRQIYQPDKNIDNSGALTFLETQIEKTKGRLVVNLKTVADLQSSPDDIILEPGDNLYIPTTPFSVHLIGGVSMPTSIMYLQNKDAVFYISQAGGFTEYADKNRVYIIKADGSVTKDLQTVELGDTIYIPEKITPKIDWLDIITKVTTTFANVLATIVLLNQVI
jgi:protein involved in polysaccharide export with SLBB domain